MKKFMILATVGLVAASCGGNAETEEKVVPETYELDTKASTLWWKGEENAEHFHYGFISAKSGSITVEGDELTEGNFIFDVNSIRPETEGYPEAKLDYLASHLKDTAFFFMAEYPEVIVKTGEYKNGKLKTVIEVLGTELSNEIPVSVKIDDKKVTMKGEFSVDFADSKMKYITEPDPETGKPGAKSVFNYKMDFIFNKK